MVKRMMIFVAAVLMAARVFAADAGAGKLNVVATILPVAAFTEKVGGKNVSVSAMIPPGANPHVYEPTPAQMKRISDARLYIKVGTNIEFERTWMKKLTEMNPAMAVCDSGKGVALIDACGSCVHGRHAAGKDPHIWLSPVNAVIMVMNIRETLSAVDPANKDEYYRNARDLIIQLSELDRDIKEKLKGIKRRSFMVFHPAWGYYALEYGLEEVSVQADAKEPSPRQMALLIGRARKDGIKAVLASPQFSSKSAEVIAKEIGGRVAFIDPLARDYVKNLEQVTEILSENGK